MKDAGEQGQGNGWKSVGCGRVEVHGGCKRGVEGSVGAARSSRCTEVASVGVEGSVGAAMSRAWKRRVAHAWVVWDCL